MVVGIEHIPELQAMAHDNLMRDPAARPLLESGAAGPAGPPQPRAAAAQSPPPKKKHARTQTHPTAPPQGRIKLVVGDGREGWEDEAPYDAIHVGAAAAELPPALVAQLAPGGVMIVSGPPLLLPSQPPLAACSGSVALCCPPAADAVCPYGRCRWVRRGAFRR